MIDTTLQASRTKEYRATTLIDMGGLLLRKMDVVYRMACHPETAGRWLCCTLFLPDHALDDVPARILLV